MLHENSHLRTFVVGRGAPKPQGGPALQGHLHHAPIADRLGKLPRRARPEDRRKPRMRLANGARRHPRLQPEGSSRPRSEVLAPQENPRRLRPQERRGSQGDAPPLPEGVRAQLKPVDFRDGRRCRLRGGSYDRARLGGDRSGHLLASSFGEVDAGQAVDHLPRPLVRKKKEGAID
jgi:hypothetical protein